MNTATTFTDTQLKTDAEYEAAIDRMLAELKRGLAEMDERDRRIEILLAKIHESNLQALKR